MKKILFSAVNLDIGGIENSLVVLLNNLASKKEYEITLILEKKEGIFLKTLNNNIKILEYTPNTNKIVLIRKLANFIKQTKFKMQYKNKFDFSCAYATYSKPASFVARTASENSALWVHSEYMQLLKNDEKKYKEFFEDIKVEQFRKIVFVSENAKNIFEENFTKLADKTLLIHNLIDGESILAKAQEPIEDTKKECFTILNVGRHTEEDKKLSRLIEVAKKLNEDNLNFRILLIGDGNKTNFYKKKVDEYNLQDKVIFLGRKQNPYPYFKIADCLVLTSEYEGFPVVYTEAMVLGLPIITTNVSDSKKIIQGKYGIVVEKDVEAISLAIKGAIENGIKQNEKFDYVTYNNEISERVKKLINKEEV